MSKLKGVLLMAYGTPRNLDEVEPYYRDIRGGRTPSPEAVEELTERYRRSEARLRSLRLPGMLPASWKRSSTGKPGAARGAHTSV